MSDCKYLHAHVSFSFILAIGDFLLDLFSGKFLHNCELCTSNLSLSVSFWVVYTLFCPHSTPVTFGISSSSLHRIICRNSEIIDSYPDTIKVTMIAACILCIVTSENWATRAQTNKQKKRLSLYISMSMYRTSTQLISYGELCIVGANTFSHEARVNGVVYVQYPLRQGHRKSTKKTKMKRFASKDKHVDSFKIARIQLHRKVVESQQRSCDKDFVDS